MPVIGKGDIEKRCMLEEGFQDGGKAHIPKRCSNQDAVRSGYGACAFDGRIRDATLAAVTVRGVGDRFHGHFAQMENRSNIALL